MNHCQNCGQVNNFGSNFCRFCGTRMAVMPPTNSNQFSPPPQQSQYPARASESLEYNPPRPYIWKTDEIQLPETNNKKSRQINQVQPLSNFSPPFQSGQQEQNLSRQTNQFHHQAAFAPVYGYRCPSCGTQHMPMLTKKISSVGWIVFAVLLVTFFPLFWIGFLIKENVKVCPVCNMKVNIQ